MRTRQSRFRRRMSDSRSKAGLGVAAGLLYICAAPLTAQIPFDGCVDRSDRPVRGVVKNDMHWAGMATVVNGESIIYWNEKATGSSSRATQVFIYLHECAHHMLGHIWKPNAPRWELEADCWAVQLMWEGGMIRGRHLRVIERELRTSRPDATHLGGQARVTSLQKCLEDKTDRKQWAGALAALVDASHDGFTSIQGQSVPTPVSETGIYESEVDLPGTYDCEITPARDFRCMVFAARTGDRVEGRFDELVKVIDAWRPEPWTPSPSAAPGEGIMRAFTVRDSAGGSTLTLSATTQHRIIFEMSRRGIELNDAEPLPMERIAFRAAAPTPPDTTLHQGASARVRVPKLGGGWIEAHVARTASETPCLLFKLDRRDAAGRTQFAFLRGVSAIEVDGKPFPLTAAQHQDKGCKR